LLKILVASVGSGFVLGAGIRFGEALVAQSSAPPDAGHNTGNSPSSSQRLPHPKKNGTAMIVSRFDNQPTEVSAVRTQVDLEGRQVDTLGEASLRFHGELRGWLEERVAARLADVETRFRGESERDQKQLLSAFADSVQTRVIHRLSKLEEEVAGQLAAMNELRECSLRTELSMQKLLGSLDKLLIENPPKIGEAKEPAPADNGISSVVVSSSAASPALPQATKASPFTVQPLVSGSVTSAYPVLNQATYEQLLAAAKVELERVRKRLVVCRNRLYRETGNYPDDLGAAIKRLEFLVRDIMAGLSA
jgi:hypothetical protein